jgi:hypothetical protein
VVQEPKRGGSRVPSSVKAGRSAIAVLCRLCLSSGPVSEPPPRSVTWIVTQPLTKLAIYRHLFGVMAIDDGSLAARNSLIFIIFVALRLTRSIFGAASVNRRVAGSNPA